LTTRQIVAQPLSLKDLDCPIKKTQRNLVMGTSETITKEKHMTEQIHRTTPIADGAGYSWLSIVTSSLLKARQQILAGKRQTRRRTKNSVIKDRVTNVARKLAPEFYDDLLLKKARGLP
jgi:hypothetical protein